MLLYCINDYSVVVISLFDAAPIVFGFCFFCDGYQVPKTCSNVVIGSRFSLGSILLRKKELVYFNCGVAVFVLFTS